ncbi:MAG: hypothetical protein IPL61_00825 [Myxococcales bacterium]|nr:hypothetical protein [Myxococcales bacterium]
MTAPITEVAAAVVDDGAAPMVVDGGPRFVGEPPRPVDGRELIDARDRRPDRLVVITRAATALAEADAARFLHGPGSPVASSTRPSRRSSGSASTRSGGRTTSSRVAAASTSARGAAAPTTARPRSGAG